MRQAWGSHWWPGNGESSGLARMLAARLAAVGLILLGVVPAQAAAAGTTLGDGARSAAARPPSTVVSLTFDDGDADQMAAARVLRHYGLAATFYIISGAVGTPGYVTRPDLRRLAADGDEIGGHTVSHLRLTALTTAETRRQVCESRSILARWGYQATSFAYPGGAYSPRAEAIVRGCGYDSARALVGLRAPGCPGCALTESTRPPNPMALATAGEVDSSWTLRDLERAVTAAGRHGGWLPLVFHHVCGGRHCGGLAVRAATLDAFARWLAQRQRRADTVVRTVGQVIGGRARPVPYVAPAAPHGVVNRSLESVAPSGAVSASLETTSASPAINPRCWMEGGYGHNTARWQRTTASYAGHWAQRLTITSYHSGDAKLLQQFDLGECSLPVRAGRSYTLGTWYQSTARTQFSVYYRTWTGRWVYWTSSPYFPASPGWAHASWATPSLPAGARGLSFGLALFSKGSLTTDGYAFTATPPDVTRPIIDWALLAALAVAGLTAAGRVVRRRRRHRGPDRRRPEEQAPQERASEQPGQVTNPVPVEGNRPTSSSRRR